MEKKTKIILASSVVLFSVATVIALVYFNNKNKGDGSNNLDSKLSNLDTISESNKNETVAPKKNLILPIKGEKQIISAVLNPVNSAVLAGQGRG